jgi:polyhydroxybutyrate depolymerase
MIRRVGIFLLLFFSAPALMVSSVVHADTIEMMRWKVDGVDRQALVYSPAADTGKTPVIFVFHGHGDNVGGSAHRMDIQDAWPEAIVVYMQGLPTISAIDPAGKLPGWQREPGDNGDRDLRFFDAVLVTLHEKFPVDNHRIYAMGFSNGAIFTYVLWGERANIFAAFAPCSGKIFPAVRLTEPKPVFIVAGAVDKLVVARDRDAAIKTARQLNGATGKGDACGPGCAVYRTTKTAEVRVLIHPGGHLYPPQISPEIVSFFKNQRLKN